MTSLVAFRAAARPFTAVRPAARTPVCIRRVVVRAAAEELDAGAQKLENASAVTDEELSLLLEEEEEVEEVDAVYAVDEEYVDDDEDDAAVLQAALEAIEAVDEDGQPLEAADYQLEAVMVGAEYLEDGEEKLAAENLLADVLQADAVVSEGAISEIAAGVAEAELGEEAEVELEDFVPAMNSDRYEERPLSAADKEAIAPYKLSKAELRNLLPADWDQINTEFFSNKKAENIPLPEFRLNLLWNVSTLGVAIDQVYSRGQVSPLTEYFFWPRQDAWEDLRLALENRPWISERDRIILLNRLTQVINFWQEGDQKPSIEAARAEFPDCVIIVV